MLLKSILLLLPAALASITSIRARASVDSQRAATELTPLLSLKSKIVLSSDPRWEALTARSTSPRIQPKYLVIVEPATEKDVQTVVTYAHKYSVPYLAVAGGHGWPQSLNNLVGGIQINLRQLNTATVDASGTTATIGGGTLQAEASRALFAKGKAAVTGLCECTSVIGPLLGGGHGLLQNQHGFASDNLVSARVVLANGTLVEASENKNKDLYWALRGAGHNFGIVTSFQIKAYDAQTWTVYQFQYGQAKLEALYALVNKIDATRPDTLLLSGVLARIPAVDAANAVLLYTLSYAGPKDEGDKWAAAFQDLDPLSEAVTENVDMGSYYALIGNDLASPVCRKNDNLNAAGASLPKWDLVGLRQAYNIFNEASADARFSTSAVLLENYGNNAARRISADSTALAPEERTLPVLASAVLWYEGNNAKTNQDANKYVFAIRDALYRGISTAKRHVYVNYAWGDEDLAGVYGRDSARIAKLKALKKAYDPTNDFRYYVPIV